MPGYLLIEQNVMKPYKADGIEPHSVEMGFLDFLRELATDEFPFPKFHELQLIGLQEVLYGARPEERGLALEIRGRLRQAASDLERRLLSVQVVLRDRLIRGDTLWVEYRRQRLPIDLIFGSPARQTDARGNHYYATSFHLTDGL